MLHLFDVFYKTRAGKWLARRPGLEVWILGAPIIFTYIVLPLAFIAALVNIVENC